MSLRSRRTAFTLASIGLSGLALLAASGCASRNPIQKVEDVPSQRTPWKFAGRDGMLLTTEHYDLHTTVTDEGLLRSLPQLVEAAYTYYRTLVPSARVPVGRMAVYLFGRRDEYEHYTKRLPAGRSETLLKVRGGGYSERGVSVIEYVAHQTTFPIMTHEGFHQYLHHCIHPNIPAWLNEGLATLCEGQRLGRGGTTEIDPWYNPMRRNALAQSLLRSELFPLEELLRINAGHVVGGSSRKIEAYYGQVWALMLFLSEGEDGKYAERFRKLLNSLGAQDIEPQAKSAFAKSTRAGYSFGQALFAAFISDDFDSVNTEYVRFMRQRIIGERATP